MLHTGAACRYETHRRVQPATALFVVGLALLLAASWPSVALGQVDSVDGPVICGTLITEDTTLINDVGPCVMGGLWIQGDGITLDLNGHTVFGAPVGTTHVGVDPTRIDPENPDPLDAWYSFDAAPVGIMSWGNEGVTIENGTVENFDSGVVVRDGTDHVVRDMVIRENGHGRVKANPTVYGEGIALWAAKDNLVEDNTITGNGPYAQIAFPYGSTGNVIRNNVLDGATLTSPATTAGAPSGMLLEGPGANNNIIEGNTITNNGAAGIRLQKYGCSTGNQIRDNEITNAGQALPNPSQDGPRGDGIDASGIPSTSLRSCATHDNVFEGNRIVDNRGHGLWLGAEASNNHVDSNEVNDNGEDGIHVSAGAFDNVLSNNEGARNGGYDGFDGSVDCGTNEWTGNAFETVNRPCVGEPDDGTDGDEGPGRSGEVPDGSEDAPEGVPGPTDGRPQGIGQGG